jgi:hypothetical protein
VSTLGEFLEARWSEREAVAKAAASRPLGEQWGGVVDGTRLTAVSAHIALHDPASVLADIASKRKLLELAGEADEIEAALHDETAHHPKPGEVSVGDQIRRVLAAPFADHPEYDQRWRPQP